VHRCTIHRDATTTDTMASLVTEGPPIHALPGLDHYIGPPGSKLKSLNASCLRRCHRKILPHTRGRGTRATPAQRDTRDPQCGDPATACGHTLTNIQMASLRTCHIALPTIYRADLYDRTSCAAYHLVFPLHPALTPTWLDGLRLQQPRQRPPAGRRPRRWAGSVRYGKTRAHHMRNSLASDMGSSMGWPQGQCPVPQKDIISGIGYIHRVHFSQYQRSLTARAGASSKDPRQVSAPNPLERASALRGDEHPHDTSPVPGTRDNMSVALALLSRASGGTGSAGAGYHEGRGGLALAEHHAGHRGPYAQPPGDLEPGQGTAKARLACRLGTSTDYLLGRTKHAGIPASN
jgi:hypothetical protein